MRKSQCWLLAAVSSVVLTAGLVHAGRFDDFTRRFQNPPDAAQIDGSSFLGGKGTEWLVAGGFQPNGQVVLIGVTLGPVLELDGNKAPVKVLGTDPGVPAAPTEPMEKARDGSPKVGTLTWQHGNSTPFIAILSEDLKTYQQVTRLPWGLGAVSGGGVDSKGFIYLTGPAGVTDTGVLGRVEVINAGENGSKKPKCAAIWLVKLDPTATQVVWAKKVVGSSTLPGVRVTDADEAVLTGPDIRTFTTDGKVKGVVAVPGGLEGNVSVNPKDGTYARGGEHHWATGREPWRCPTLNIYKPDGKHLYQLYDWGGPMVGTDRLREVSDTAIRGVVYDPEGNLIITAWSDGGNSVARREPMDINRMHGKFEKGLGFSNWGANVLSAAYIIKIDTKTYKVMGGTLWSAYLSGEKDKPNSIWIDTLGFASDGSAVIAGRSASGLIRTGTHLTQLGYPADMPPAGDYITVLNPDLTSLRFSVSYFGAGKVILGDGDRWGFASGKVKGRHKLLALTGAKAEGEAYAVKVPMPSLKGPQTKYGGGLLDGYFVQLDLGAAK